MCKLWCMFLKLAFHQSFFVLKQLFINYVNKKWYYLQLLEWNMLKFIVFISFDFESNTFYTEIVETVEEYKEESFQSDP